MCLCVCVCVQGDCVLYICVPSSQDLATMFLKRAEIPSSILLRWYEFMWERLNAHFPSGGATRHNRLPRDGTY